MKHTRHTKADKLQPHQDRFAGLLWDCKEIILRHLTRHDLAQCEQVNKVWQSLVHEWIIAPNGYCMLFPESWRLEMQAGANDDEKVRRVKDVDVRYTRYTKLRSGRASSGRVIGTEIDIREWSRAVVEGDFAAWLGTDWIFTQRLGFQPDGSLYPIRKLYNPCSEADECSLRLSPCGSVLLCSSRSIIPSPDAARRTLLYGRPIWDRITSQSDHGARDQVYALSTETGWYLWKREAPIFTELIIGVGETRVYSLRREPGCEPLKFLVTQDLYSGAVLNTVSIQNDALECALAGICCVRQLNGKDVLVTFNAQYQPRQPPDTLPYPIMLTSGHIQIIRPEYGTIIQTIESNRCNSANPDMRIMPSPMNAEDFAFVCRGPERGGCHGYKVYKLSPHATGGSRGRKKGKKYKYHITSTEVIKFNKLHVYPVGVDIDPFRNLFVVMASSFDAPLILPMEELTAPFGGKAARHDGLDLDLDLALEGHVDKWLASGPGSAITLLRTREKKVDYEILTIRDTPTLCCIPKVCFAGRDKVLIYTGVQQYLFDFAFRNHRRYTMRNKPGRIKELGGIGELEDGRGRLKSRYAYDA